MVHANKMKSDQPGSNENKQTTGLRRRGVVKKVKWTEQFIPKEAETTKLFFVRSPKSISFGF